jgi:hypothetical protein
LGQVEILPYGTAARAVLVERGWVVSMAGSFSRSMKLRWTQPRSTRTARSLPASFSGVTT